ncbi:MAG: NAD(P)H-quinone oxidoreductase [Bacteroidota bacterium]
MRVANFDQSREFSGVHLGEAPDPVPASNEVLVHVVATALNRSDLLQVQGYYPAPADASPILGLEIAGTIIATGAEVTEYTVGDNVCALVNGGGFAQLASVPQDMLLPLPERLSFTKAAAIPEVWLTAYQALHWIAKIEAGEHVLIHAGASGVGTAAIQLARLAGAIPIVTASPNKHERLRGLGAERCIDYQRENFAKVAQEMTDGKGVEVILDFIGAPYVKRNAQAVAVDGRALLLGFLGGRYVDNLDVAPFLLKRIQVTGSTLRNRPAEYKSRLTADFRRDVWEHFSTQRLQPVVDTIYDWEETPRAMTYMASNANVGKIVLTIGD